MEVDAETKPESPEERLLALLESKSSLKVSFMLHSDFGCIVALLLLIALICACSMSR